MKKKGKGIERMENRDYLRMFGEDCTQYKQCKQDIEQEYDIKITNSTDRN